MVQLNIFIRFVNTEDVRFCMASTNSIPICMYILIPRILWKSELGIHCLYICFSYNMHMYVKGAYYFTINNSLQCFTHTLSL